MAVFVPAAIVFRLNVVFGLAGADITCFMMMMREPQLLDSAPRMRHMRHMRRMGTMGNMGNMMTTRTMRAMRAMGNMGNMGTMVTMRRMWHMGPSWMLKGSGRVEAEVGGKLYVQINLLRTMDKVD